MLKGSGKYKLQRPEKGTSGFYQCVGMEHRALSPFNDNRISKKRLVDHFIINVGGGNLGYDLQPKLSKSVMVSEATGISSQNVLYDEMSIDRIDIDDV